MQLGNHGKLGIAVVASMGLHAAVLMPLKAPMGPQIATPLPQAFLSASLWQAPAPLAAPEITPVRSPLAFKPPEPSLREPPAEPVALRQPEMQTRRSEPDSAEKPAAPLKPTPPPPQSSGEQDGQNRPGVRVATPDEVKVRVHLYKKDADDNPNEVMDTGSAKYIYFNAPRLKQSAQPIDDAKPHYPTGKLDYPHGAVTLMLQIDEAGKIEKTSVLCAQPAFKDSALASIREMRFEPAREASGPVKSYMFVDFAYGIGAPCGPIPHNLVSGKRPG
jgi:outer membrane biosynthesis protein TonB